MPKVNKYSRTSANVWLKFCRQIRVGHGSTFFQTETNAILRYLVWNRISKLCATTDSNADFQSW